MQNAPCLLADRAADLQRGPLPSGRAAAEMGQHRAQKDGGRQQDGQRTVPIHRVKHVIGPQTPGFCQLIKAHNGKARRRQAPQKPGPFRPQLRRNVDRCVKGRAHHTAENPYQQRNRQPLPHRRGIRPRGPQSR